MSETLSINILCVDDDEQVLKTLRRLLHRPNWQVFSFTSAHEAIKSLDERAYHVIVSDYRMPMINGVQFLEYVKAKSPDTPRILLSGGFDTSAVAAAVNRAEVFRVFTKPWNSDELLLAVEKAIGSALSADKIKSENHDLLYVETNEDGSITLDDVSDD